MFVCRLEAIKVIPTCLLSADAVYQVILIAKPLPNRELESNLLDSTTPQSTFISQL